MLPVETWCGRQVCTAFITNYGRAQINLTVLNLVYEGQRSETCEFGGFVTSQVHHLGYTESPILCASLEKHVYHPVLFQAILFHEGHILSQFNTLWNN